MAFVENRVLLIQHQRVRLYTKDASIAAYKNAPQAPFNIASTSA